MRPPSSSTLVRVAAVAVAAAAPAGLINHSASAQTYPPGVSTPSPAPSPTEQKPEEAKPPAPTPGYWDTLKLSGHVQFGATFNPDQGRDDENFGRLVTDKANRVLLNQLAITAERPIDPKSADYDVGFKFQAIYGADARYYHFINEFARDITDTNQVDIVEANLVGHIPLAEGSVDVKIGQYPTPLGAEVIDPTNNYLYSHSYIFNFGLPFKHTGGYATIHASDLVDLYLGGDTGSNTTLFKGDNNSAPAFLGGFGLNFSDNLTLLALTHIGPEIPGGIPGIHADGDLRYFNDIVVTYKPIDPLTLISELNYIQDDQFPSLNPGGSVGLRGWGIAQYGIYNLSDEIALVARGELFDDVSGNVVSDYVGNLDFVNSQINAPINIRDRASGQRTLYGELTLGVNYKPPVPDLVKGLVIRPEVRVDKALSNGHPFDGILTAAGTTVGTKDYQVTFGVDVVVPF